MTILQTLQQWRIHPVADHFTIALLTVAVLIDLVGSLASSRVWIRYMALTLMILGAGSAAASWVTGGWEAHRVYHSLAGPAKELLGDHARLGDWLVWIFAILAVWRLAIQAFTFAAGTRGLYLIAAIVAICLLGYQGYMGGELVYQHGVGTAMGAAPSPQQTVAPLPGVSTPLPTVFAPPATPTPTSTPTDTPTATVASPSATPTPRGGAGTVITVPTATPTVG